MPETQNANEMGRTRTIMLVSTTGLSRCGGSALISTLSHSWVIWTYPVMSPIPTRVKSQKLWSLGDTFYNSTRRECRDAPRPRRYCVCAFTAAIPIVVCEPSESRLVEAKKAVRQKTARFVKSWRKERIAGAMSLARGGAM